MENLTSSLNKLILQSFGEFAEAVAQKYNVSKDEVLALCPNNFVSEVNSVPAASSSKSAPKTTRKAVSKSDTKEKCEYKATRGENKGKACCQSSKSADSDYCSKHRKIMEKRVEPKAKTPASKTTKKNDETEKKVIKTLNKDNYTISKSKHGNYVAVDTNLVFDVKEQKAVGTENDEGSVVALSSEDIELCKQKGFPYKVPENLVKTGDASEEDTDEESEEEDSSSSEESDDEDDEDED